MKRTEPISLGDVMRDALAQYHADERLKEVKAAKLWGELVGPAVEARTEKVYVDNSVMHVHIESAPLRNELAMQRSRMVESINRALGPDVISDIKFLSSTNK